MLPADAQISVVRDEQLSQSFDQSPCEAIAHPDSGSRQKDLPGTTPKNIIRKIP
ncbi:hypothetical protein [Picosynechococcus sp. NKBG15041c]|uniref:hypothetical protein n=1 Tax=Picosynechococcus sp. NKBG15041c TaxID=1407650 RepID=UPI00041A0F7F|nr:hypothetical protein [Picosynechococcus sp. NKBG15041c]